MSTPLTKALADAITRQEGWFPGSASQKHNNPGNIMDIDYYRATIDPATGQGQFRLQQYATPEAGRSALERLVDKYIAAGHTLNSFFTKYAPSAHGGNNPGIYANNVAGWLGIPADVPLKQLEYAGASTGNAGGPVEVAIGPMGGPTIATESEMGTLPLLLLAGAAGAVLWWVWD